MSSIMLERAGNVKPYFQKTQEIFRRPTYTQPKPLRVKSMTMAAGFRCLNGVALAADTELTLGEEGKTQETKLFQINLEQHCWLTYAGHTAFIKALVEELKSSTIGVEGRGLVDLIRRTFKRRIDKHYNKAIDISRTWADVLVTVREGEYVSLYAGHTEGGHFVSVPTYQLHGIGQSQGEALFSSMYDRNMEVTDAVRMAVYVMGKAKGFVRGVGGTTEVVWLEDRLKMPIAFQALKEQTEQMEKDFDFFDKEASRVILDFANFDTSIAAALADLTQPGVNRPKIDRQKFHRRLKSFENSLQAYRSGRLKDAERERRQLVKISEQQ